MDRQRYALIFGPIIGLIIFYLIFTTMSDQLRADQDTLRELGPVTMQEVAQNPSLVAGADEGEEAIAEEEEGIAEEMAAADAGEAGDGDAAAMEEEAGAEAESSGEEMAVDDAASDEMSAEEATEDEAVEDAAIEAEVATEEDAIDSSATLTETTVVTATDEAVIISTVTDTARILGGAYVAENIVWYAHEYLDSNGDMVETAADSAITALFNLGTISGSTTCSNYTGRYSADAEGIFTVELTAIAPAGATREECSDGGVLAVQEADYLAALARSVTFEASESTMEVSDEEGNLLIHYEVVEAE